MSVDRVSDIAAPEVLPGIVMNREVTVAVLTAADTRKKIGWGNYVVNEVFIEIIPTNTTVDDNLIFWFTFDPVSDEQSDVALDTPSATDGTVSEKRYPLTVKRGREGGLALKFENAIASLYFKNARVLGAAESYTIFVSAGTIQEKWPL